MTKPWAKLILALTLCFCLGLKWMVLQSIAWVNMTVEYASEEPWSVAFDKALSGKDPCQMCQFVKHGQKTEESQEKGSWVKGDIYLPTEGFVVYWQELADEPLTLVLTPSLRSVAPSLPPPRLA